MRIVRAKLWAPCVCLRSNMQSSAAGASQGWVVCLRGSPGLTFKQKSMLLCSPKRSDQSDCRPQSPHDAVLCSTRKEGLALRKQEARRCIWFSSPSAGKSLPLLFFQAESTKQLKWSISFNCNLEPCSLQWNEFSPPWLGYAYEIYMCYC